LEDAETKVVYTSGNWDLFHIGHLNFLEKAKSLGDFLVVGVGTNESMIERQGKAPMIPFEQRCRIIAALRSVDCVVPWTSEMQGVETAIACGATVRAIKPPFAQTQPQAKEELEKRGVEHVLIPRTPNISSAEIKEECYEEVARTRICVGVCANRMQSPEA